MTADEIREAGEDPRAAKIAGLLRKAESTTPEEAEALVAKAAELMAKWEIDDALVRLAMGKSNAKAEEIVQLTLQVTGIYFAPTLQLGHSIARRTGVRSIQSRRYQGKTEHDLYLIGYESDVHRAEMLFTSCLIQSMTAMQAHMRDSSRSWMTGSQRFNERRSFLFGYADGVGEILTNANRAAQAATKAESTERGHSMELALVDRKQKVNERVDTKFGRLRHVNQRAKIGSGYGQGREAGRNANLGGTGVGGNKKALGR